MAEAALAACRRWSRRNCIIPRRAMRCMCSRFPTEDRIWLHPSRQYDPITPYALAGKQVHSRRPGLILDAHRFSSFAMVPLVELSGLVQFRQPPPGCSRNIPSAGLYQSGYVESAEEWPHSAIMVVVRGVEGTIVIAP